MKLVWNVRHAPLRVSRALATFALTFSCLRNARNNTRSAGYQFLKFNQSVGQTINQNVKLKEFTFMGENACRFDVNNKD